MKRVLILKQGELTHVTNRTADRKNRANGDVAATAEKCLVENRLGGHGLTIDTKRDILSEQLDSVLEQEDKISEHDAKIEGLGLRCHLFGIL